MLGHYNPSQVTYLHLAITKTELCIFALVKVKSDMFCHCQEQEESSLHFLGKHSAAMRIRFPLPWITATQEISVVFSILPYCSGGLTYNTERHTFMIQKDDHLLFVSFACYLSPVIFIVDVFYCCSELLPTVGKLQNITW